MKNKKKLILIGLIAVIIVVASTVTLSLTLFKSSDNEIVSNPKREVNNNNNFITLMIEQEDGSYQESTSNTWPDGNYVFNKELSRCENGGELDWDRETNRVILYSNKSDGCYVYFDKYLSPTVSSVSVANTTASSISVSVNAIGGTNNVATYYYSINNGAYTSSSSNTHTFSGLSKGTTYTIKVYVKDTNGVDSSVYTINAETESAVLLADYIKGLYTSQGSNGIYYHTSSLANSAGDNSYRYSGANPNNYVCFGSDAATCPSGNLYRIIGLFGSEVKLIKSTSYGNYAWDSGGYDNTWSTSDIKNTLNTSYLNTISSTWQNKITTHAWKVGGLTRTNGYSTDVQTAYQYEVGSNSSSITDTMKIGLMYISDYGFAASSSYWTTALQSYNNGAYRNDWLYLGSTSAQWTISRISDDYRCAFFAGIFGDVSYNSTDGKLAVRPSFYLTSSITYVSGSGTSSDPIRIT